MDRKSKNDVLLAIVIFILTNKWKFLPQYAKQSERALGAEFKLNSWHLQLIGVAPEKQRRGIGTALIRAIENKVIPSLFQ